MEQNIMEALMISTAFRKNQRSLKHLPAQDILLRAQVNSCRL